MGSHPSTYAIDVAAFATQKPAESWCPWSMRPEKIEQALVSTEMGTRRAKGRAQIAGFAVSSRNAGMRSRPGIAASCELTSSDSIATIAWGVMPALASAVAAVFTHKTSACSLAARSAPMFLSRLGPAATMIAGTPASAPFIAGSPGVRASPAKFAR
jgi:hypothetical protein